MAGIFISYSHEDVRASREIHAALESKGITCWRDERWLEAGADFAEEIARAVRECDLFILLISSHSVASDYVSIELGLARHFNKRIVPVFLASTSIPDKILPYIVRLHRLDVPEGRFDEHLPSVVESILRLLAEGAPQSSAEPASPSQQESVPLTCPLVTNDQYLNFVREMRHRRPPHWNSTPPHFAPNEAHLPVSRVTWNDATAYCDWAAGKLPEAKSSPMNGGCMWAAGAPSAEWVDAGTETVKQVRHSNSWELLCLLDRSAQQQNIGFRCAQIQPHVPRGVVFLDEGRFVLGTDLKVFSRVANNYRLPLALQRPILSRPAGPRSLKGFQISKFCVTNLDYWEFVQKTGHRMPKHWDIKQRERHGVPFSLREAACPVVNVTALDARQYCVWSNTRLPSTLEWERAARGDGSRPYPWGDAYDPQRCNSIESDRGHAVAADEYDAGDTPEGVRQMCGNVFEWTVGAGGTFELRGGSWRAANEVWGLTYAFREAPPSHSADDVGFRVVLR